MGYSDSWYSHKRAIVASVTLVVLVIIGLTIYSYSSSSSPKTIRYNFNGTWKEWNLFGKLTPIPLKNLKDKNDSLIIVSRDEMLMKHIYLDFENKANDCDIEVKLEIFDDDDHFNAFNLGDGKILVSLENDNSMEGIRHWKIFIINPDNCTYSDLPLIKFYNEEKILDILPYHNTFDVVMQNRKNLSSKVQIFRYDDKGSLVKNFSISTQGEEIKKIHMINPIDVSQGYYYIATYPKSAHQSMLKKFNNKFELVESLNLTQEILDENAFSMNNGKLFMCYFNDTMRKDLTCQIIYPTTSKKILASAAIHSKDPIKLVTIISLPQGGVMIVHTTDNGEIFAQLMSKKGVFDQLTKIEKSKRDWEEEIESVRMLQMKNGSYYLVVSSPKFTWTKLITPEKI